MIDEPDADSAWKNVYSLKDVLERYCDLIEDEGGEYSLTTLKQMKQELQTDLDIMNAHDKGRETVNAIIKKHLTADATESFYENIPKSKLKTMGQHSKMKHTECKEDPAKATCSDCNR
ncbi:hypothetical protein Y1Q_0023176 [Alligator mississippiensis]|nr:hypothetical protein Y1Q_0023176 [Alligator mississippiensis]